MGELLDRLRGLRAAGSILQGLSTFTFYRPTTDLRSVLDRDGVRGDWERVGSDLRRAMRSVDHLARRDRSSAERDAD